MTALCAYCTLPATRHTTVDGKHYPRLCSVHWRIVTFGNSPLPEIVNKDEADADTPPNP